ncbi:DUF4112 domain-containing protein [Sphingomonas sp. RS6]
MTRARRMEQGFTDRLPLGRDAAAVRQRIEAMEHLLERSLTIPGTSQKLGLDVVLDFVPGIGPSVAAAMGAYLAWEARNLGMPKRTIARMAGNIGVDWALGMIPFVGAIPDFFFRSNTRNVRLIKRYLDKHHPASRVIEQP